MREINTFWNWFQDKEEAIKNAFILGINTKEIFHHLDRNYKYISKRIGYLIIGNSKKQDKYTIIFTAAGYRKLFPKIIALEDQAPQLKHFIPQAFIKPIQNTTPYKEGTDAAFIYDNYEIKISQLQMALIDYNSNAKQLKIKLYIPNYDKKKQHKELETDLKFIVMEVIGEIAFKKHIKYIEFAQLPASPNGLLSLIELPEYIAYLYKINSRQKTRTV
jgi:hypothetical protein